MRKKNQAHFLNGVRTLGVVCNQWGDTGKGKFIDFFAEDWADVIARGTGGANAGHTISLHGKEYVFHLVPSGILHDGAGKTNIIGSGVAFDPAIISNELKILRKARFSHDRLLFSQNANLVLPQHLVLDRARESKKKGKIGTTGRGIGPLYADRVSRNGLVLNDLLNKDRFAKKLERNLEEKVKLLKLLDHDVVKAIMMHEHLGSGKFWHPRKIFDRDAIVESYVRYGKKFNDMITDTDELLRQKIGKVNVLLEGAQGLLLSVDYGAHPFVTSSDCSIQGLAKGVGLSEKAVDLTLGIVKFPYMTRVGEGSFPTEIGGETSDRWCSQKGMNKAKELESFDSATVNEDHEFLQGIGIRMAGNEYGATTGRPRRTGWIDLPLLRYAMKFNGPNAILTKLDVLDECREIKICIAHEYRGRSYRLGDRVLAKGDLLEVAIPDSYVLANCRPVYMTLPGWVEPISKIRRWKDLPKALTDIIGFSAKQSGMNPRILSVGPDRDATIVV